MLITSGITDGFLCGSWTCSNLCFKPCKFFSLLIMCKPYVICFSLFIFYFFIVGASIGFLKISILYSFVKSVAITFFPVVYIVDVSGLSLFRCLCFITYLFQAGNNYSYSPINILYSSSIFEQFFLCNFFCCFLKAFDFCFFPIPSLYFYFSPPTGYRNVLFLNLYVLLATVTYVCYECRFDIYVWHFS